MTQAAEALLQRIEHTRQVNVTARVKAATDLRDAVTIFNAQPISISAVDAFRQRVLIVADHLAALPTDMGDSLLAATLGVNPVLADKRNMDARLELRDMDVERHDADFGDLS